MTSGEDQRALLRQLIAGEGRHRHTGPELARGSPLTGHATGWVCYLTSQSPFPHLLKLLIKPAHSIAHTKQHVPSGLLGCSVNTSLRPGNLHWTLEGGGSKGCSVLLTPTALPAQGHSQRSTRQELKRQGLPEIGGRAPRALAVGSGRKQIPAAIGLGSNPDCTW